jgi:hypothetical protein
MEVHAAPLAAGSPVVRPISPPHPEPLQVNLMKLKLLTLLLAAGALTAACDDDEGNTGPESQARVRIVHASPDAPAVDVLVDDAEVLSGVPYRTASDYLELSDGEHNLKVNAAGTATTVIDADVELEDGADYTVIAGGLLEAIEPIVLVDDNGAPAAGSVRIRAVHGAPSAPAVDVYVTAPGADLASATPALTAVQFGDVADYLEAPAGDYQVRVTAAGTKTVVIDSGALTLASGQIRTAIAVEATGGGAPFDLLVLDDLN